MEYDSTLSALPSLPSLLGGATAVPSSDAGPSMASKIASWALFGGVPIQRVVVVGLGFLLIAAGIFSFRPARELVVTSAKGAAKAAAAA